MIGYPLDSHVVFEDGVPQYDRAISSAPLRELFKRLFSDGVLPDVASNLMVQYVGSTRVAGTVSGDTESYNVVVNAGFGICAGCLKLQENFYGLAMNLANTTLPRIDTVVLRLDDNDAVRSCDFHIVQGVPATNPVPPALTRDSSVWEIGLANLYKPPMVSSTNPVTVTDTRLDPDRCGIISSISEFDTSALYKQVQDAMVHYQTVTEAEFNTWFNEMRDRLSDDAAGNLQAQIGAIVSLVTNDKTDLVHAINEIARTVVREETIVYVSNAGSDTTGDGSSAKPYATIQKAVDSIPKNLNGYVVYVSIAPGTYPEMVEVTGFSNGELRFTGVAGSVITIDKLTIDTTGVFSCQTIQLNVPTGSKDTVAIDVTGNSYATFGQPVTVSGTETGVVVREEARVRFTTLTANNINGSAVYANGGRAHIQTLAGTGNGVAINANRGGVATYESMTLTSAVRFYASNGGRIYTGSQASIPSY